MLPRSVDLLESSIFHAAERNALRRVFGGDVRLQRLRIHIAPETCPFLKLDPLKDRACGVGRLGRGVRRLMLSLRILAERERIAMIDLRERDQCRPTFGRLSRNA